MTEYSDNMHKNEEKLKNKSIRFNRANTLIKPLNSFKIKEIDKKGTSFKSNEFNRIKNKKNENSKINDFHLYKDRESYNYYNNKFKSSPIISNNMYNKNLNPINKNIHDSKIGSYSIKDSKIKTTKLKIVSKNKINENTDRIDSKKEKKEYKKRDTSLLGKKIKRPEKNQTNTIITLDNKNYYLIEINEKNENILKNNRLPNYEKRKILNENIQNNNKNNIPKSQDITKTNGKEKLLEINHQEIISINGSGNKIPQKIGQIEKNKMLTIHKNIIEINYQGFNIIEKYIKKLKIKTEINLNINGVCNNNSKQKEINNITNNEDNLSDTNLTILIKKKESNEIIEKINKLENKFNSIKIEDNKNILESKKDFITYEKHKIYGFSNLGNNCYLNSSLQLLTRIDEFKNYILNFKEIQTENNETKGNLILEFKKMLRTIESSNNNKLIIDPSELKRIMGYVDERYFEDHQEDSNEFISNFIDALLWETGNTKKLEKIKNLQLINEDEKNAYISFYKKFYKRRGYSFILDLFYGINKTNKFCKACNKIFTIKFNSFNMIELPIFELANKTKNNYLTFDEIINKYLGYNKIKSICKYCKNEEEIYSKISLYTLPKYLIISFGRSINDKYVYTDIKYNDILKIKSEFDNNEYNYKLECVIQHSGGANFGHYTALCPKDTSNKIWYRYSDEDCNQDDTNTNFQSKIAIILLYKCI
jgi:ubiquitin C-terminal hydrolase